MINYVKVKREIHVGANPGTKYLARLWRNEDVSLDTIAQEISDATTVSYPDVLAALKAFEIHVSKYVLNGSAVKFGTLGAFIPTITAKCQLSVDKVTADTIKRTRCRFYPSKDFMKKLAKAQYQLKDLTVTGIQG
jgi:predicted histone-like DNA-binding protein